MEHQTLYNHTKESDQQQELSGDIFTILNKNFEDAWISLQQPLVDLKKIEPMITVPSDDLLAEYYYYCESFSYRLWNGIFIPVVALVHAKERLSTYWHGTIGLKFNSVKYCTSCQKTTENLDDLGYCPICKENMQNKQHCCRIVGAGKPFQTLCDIKDPVCGDPERSTTICQKNHVVYILRINSILKVGTSMQDRGQVPNGYLYRILEQGADEAWVWINKNTKNLAEIQEVEESINKVFTITDKLTTNEKILLRKQPYLNNTPEEFIDIIKEVQGYLGPEWVQIHYPNLTDATLFSPDISQTQVIQRYQDAEVWHFEPQLIGTILATWGKLSLVEKENKDIIIPLKEIEQHFWGSGELGW